MNNKYKIACLLALMSTNSWAATVKLDSSAFNVTATSEEKGGEGPVNGYVTAAFDGDVTTFWHSEWSNYEDPTYPYMIDIDLGGEYAVNKLDYLPRMDKVAEGVIGDYEILVSTDGATYTSVKTGSWAATNDLLETTFTATLASYVRIVVNNAVKPSGSDDFVAAAEIGIYADDTPQGGTAIKFPIDPANVTSTSEELTGEGAPNGWITSAFDGDATTFWHSEWSSYAGTTFPYTIDINLGDIYKVSQFDYLPRGGGKGGIIADYELLVSTDGVTYTSVNMATFDDTEDLKSVSFTSESAQWVRLVASSTASGNLDIASAAELSVYVDSLTPAKYVLDPANFIVQTNSEELTGEGAPNGHIISAFDDDLTTFWHSEWSSYTGTTYPYTVDVDLGDLYKLNSFGYTPGRDGVKGGNIESYEIYTSQDGATYTLATSGSWADDGSYKEASFSTQLAAYIRLVALSTASGNLDIASAAEFNVLAESTTPELPVIAAVKLDPLNFIAHASSEEASGEDATANYAFDEDPSTFWHTEWDLAQTPYPHTLDIDLSGVYEVNGFAYTPRGNGTGRISEYEILVSVDGVSFSKVKAGTWAENDDKQEATFSAKEARWVRLVAIDGFNDEHFAAASEIDVFAVSAESLAEVTLVTQLSSENFMPIVSSEEAGGEGPVNGYITGAFDGKANTFWHTQWDIPVGELEPVFPYTLIIDLGASYDVTRFDYVTRGLDSGNITEYQLYLSNDRCVNFNDPIMAGNWDDNPETKSTTFAPTLARYVKLVMTKGGVYADSGEEQQFASAAEFEVYHTFESLGDNPERTSTIETTSVCTLAPNAPGQDWVAEDGSIQAVEDEVFEGQLPNVDLENQALTYQFVSNTTNGELTLDVNGTYTYTPNLDYWGADSFVYAVTNSNGGQTQGTITIDVKPALLVIADPDQSSGGSSSITLMMFLSLLLSFRRFKI
jgi:hypothetical protein